MSPFIAPVEVHNYQLIVMDKSYKIRKQGYYLLISNKNEDPYVMMLLTKMLHLWSVTHYLELPRYFHGLGVYNVIIQHFGWMM